VDLLVLLQEHAEHHAGGPIALGQRVMGPTSFPTTRGDTTRQRLGLDDVASVRRVLETVTVDTARLDNSIARDKFLIAAVGAAAKLLEAEREGA